MVESYATSVCMIVKCVMEGELTLEHFVAINNVCHDQKVYNTDFFYIYMCIFTDWFIFLNTLWVVYYGCVVYYEHDINTT